MDFAAAAPAALPLDQFLLILRLALVALLYLVILQIVAVARRDMRRLAKAPTDKSVLGHLVVIDSGSSPLLPGAKLDLGYLTTIGRGPTNSIVLDSTFVSTEHTKIEYRNRSLWVEDMGSRNGTTVNREPVTQAVAVKPGDVLQVGDVRFKLAV